MTERCAFCRISKPVLRAPLVYALWDKHPVAPGHLLVLPNRHVASYFDCTDEERRALWQMVEDAKRLLDLRHVPDGYNLGVNVGEAAGQSVFHVHVHVIPRYAGDTADPWGGVRGVIPAKQSY